MLTPLFSPQADKNTLDVEVSESEMAERKKSWKQREPKVTQGTLWKYIKNVSDASHGAVTDLYVPPTSS